jgi:hypothetical protein
MRMIRELRSQRRDGSCLGRATVDACEILTPRLPRTHAAGKSRARTMNLCPETLPEKGVIFLSSLWALLRVAACVGLSSSDHDGRVGEHEDGGGPKTARPVRSMLDYSGYLTRDGLGSLDVGGGVTPLGK